MPRAPTARMWRREQDQIEREQHLRKWQCALEPSAQECRLDQYFFRCDDKVPSVDRTGSTDRLRHHLPA